MMNSDDGVPGAAPDQGARVLVIGIGNMFRCDDSVGPWVAGKLAARGLEARELSGEGAGLIEAWQGHDTVHVVDATQSGATPGTLHRLDAIEIAPPQRFFRASSHLFGLAEAIATARALGRLPPHLIVWGIEGQEFGFGQDLSPAVAATAQRVVEEIAAATAVAGAA